jgi:hypothetical protein
VIQGALRAVVPPCVESLEDPSAAADDVLTGAHRDPIETD